MPAAVAIPAAVSVGSSLLGGILGSGAAKKAARIQSEASTKAADELKAQLGIYNPQIGATADAAARGVTDATTAGQAGIRGAVGAGQGRIDSATGQAIGYLQPYMDAGGESLQTLRSMMAPGGDLNKTFTAQDMQQYDPGYAFRMAQANKAMMGSAAARGGALGGGTLAAMQGMNQNLASAEFANAEGRFRNQQQSRFDRLNTLVNLGEKTATQAGSFGQTGADMWSRLGLTGETSAADLGYRGAASAGGFTTDAARAMATNALNTYGKIGDLMTGGAAAQAGGVVGSANAWNGALSGVASGVNQVGQYKQDQMTMRDLMLNPALRGTDVGGGYGFVVNPRTGHGYRQ